MRAAFGVLTFILALGVHSAHAAGPMKKGERDRLVAHLEMTESWLVDEVSGLSQAQIDFRPRPDAWSIKDVVEHLAIAEPQYWKDLQESVKKDPVEYEKRATDEGMLWYGIDRTQRQTTGEARRPSGQFKTLEEGLASFRKLRATMLTTARESQDDYRGLRYVTSAMDCYQWFLMISSHSQRHILQIREIKADPKFPKK